MTADHSDRQPNRHGSRPAGTFLGLVALIVVACSGAPATSVAGSPAVTLAMAAESNKFDTSALEVPAGAPFVIEFDNRDSVPHNVAIRGGPSPMSGEIFSGPGERTYTFQALAAGSYSFLCEVHSEMNGTLTAN